MAILVLKNKEIERIGWRQSFLSSLSSEYLPWVKRVLGIQHPEGGYYFPVAVRFEGDDVEASFDWVPLNEEVKSPIHWPSDWVTEVTEKSRAFHEGNKQ